MAEVETRIWRRQLKGKPGDLSSRAGLLFMLGSTCFALGSFPPYFLNLTAQLVGLTFFIGSIFFTSAGVIQLQDITAGWGRLIQLGDKVWWATVVQLVGMISFNINTFRAAFVDVPTDEVNRLIWAPDFLTTSFATSGSSVQIRSAPPTPWSDGLLSPSGSFRFTIVKPRAPRVAHKTRPRSTSFMGGHSVLPNQLRDYLAPT